MTSGPLRTEVMRVQLADTDAAGVLYYAAPFRWAEGLFSRWLAESGHPLSTILDSGVGFPIVSAECSFHRAVRLDDVLESTLRIAAVGNRSADVHYAFARVGSGGPDVEVRVRLVYSAFAPDQHVDALPRWFLELCGDGPVRR